MSLTFTIDGADGQGLGRRSTHQAFKEWQISNSEFIIADVSYYVTEGSALDKEALNRATSVYVTDRVVPMLPERLFKWHLLSQSSSRSLDPVCYYGN